MNIIKNFITKITRCIIFFQIVNKFIIFFFILFFGDALTLKADVFLLAPFSTTFSFSTLNPLELWTEPIFINGTRTTLKIALLQKSLEESLQLLKSFYPNAKFAINEKSILMEVIDGELKKRLYLVECGHPPYPVVQFYLEYKSIPQNIEWHPSLPTAPDIKPLQIIEFPERKSIYGRFSSPFRPKEILSVLNSTLLADGWHPLTREAARALLGTSKGEFYIKYNPTEVISISVIERDDSSSEAIVYKKTLKF